MWKQVRRKAVCFLAAAVCSGLCGWLFPATGIWAEPFSGQKEAEPMDDSWMDKEVAVALDENNMDENGCTYRLSSGTERTAEMEKVHVTNGQDWREDIQIRVPDRVVKEGKVYVVTGIRVMLDTPVETIRADISFLCGKEVRDIIWDSMPCASVCYPHVDSKYFSTENGVLFNRDKTELIHFNNKQYGADKVYEIPETVTAIRGHAFDHAQIKEVVLNDKITAIPWRAFESSTLQRMDLKNVTSINDYAFSDCKALKEVRIRQEGVSIEQSAFAWSGIESLYLPPGTCIDSLGDFRRCENLKTVVIGEGFRINNTLDWTEGAFNDCISLQTVILPDGMPELMENMFDRCMSLRKLYVPDSVKSIGDKAFHVSGNLTLYAEKESPAAAYEDDNVNFVDVSGHTHTLKEVMFIKYDTWGVKGKYCEECGYGTQTEAVEFDGGAADDVPMMEAEKDICPEVLELDEYNTDEQGVVYRVDTEGKTASVIDIDDTRPFPKEFIMVPEFVEKDGTRYPVELIDDGGLNGASIILLSDSVKELKPWSVDSVSKLRFGKQVEKIHTHAFGSYVKEIEISGENPYYRVIDGVLYTSDKKTLLRRTMNADNYYEKEYKIPTAVTKVISYAFAKNYELERIDIYNCGEIEIEDRGLEGCDAELCYADGYTWYDVEDTVFDLDRKNQDENGCVYRLEGADKTAQLSSFDVSRYDKSAKELTVKIPDCVRRDGKVYKVTMANLYSEVTAPDDTRVRLFIGKYLTEIVSMPQHPYQITSYNNLENDAFTSEKGSLFDRERTCLYRFCDDAFDCSSVYKLPDETVRIAAYAFSGTDIQKVDMNQAAEIGSHSFYKCKSLEEARMSREDTIIQDAAFMCTKKLKYMYIPDKCALLSRCFEESGLRAIILGDGAECISFQDDRGQFALCSDLEICALPESLTTLTGGLFRNCLSLKKLYIPRGVEEVGEDCFTYVTANIYGREGGVVEEGVKNSKTAQFVSLRNHTHRLERVTFFAYETWAVTGDYCEECAYAAQCTSVALQSEEDRAELPPMLFEELPAPTVPPTAVPTAIPTAIPTVVPSATSSAEPMVPTTVPSLTPSTEPAATDSMVSDVNRISYKQGLVVKNFKINSRNNKSARLQWKGGKSADSYRIYRSRKKNGTYRAVKTVAKNRNYFVDKKIKPTVKYYYKIKALGHFDGKEIEGNESPIRSICVSGIRNPKISVKKGRLKQICYVSVRLRKYQGDYADIHISINRKKFKKLKLVSNRISKYKGKFEIQYVIRNKEIRFKVRTYRKNGKKKVYSHFSNVVRVKV